MRGQHVIVVGAGLSGLVAAHELARRGAAISLLDARDRVGGRVWTVRDGFAAGQHGELGAEFVDEDHRRVRALLDRFTLPLVRTRRAGFMHRYRLPDGEVRLSRGGPWERLRGELAPAVRTFRAARGAPNADAVRELATWSLRDWLTRHEADADVHAMVDTMRGFFLAEPGELSLLPVVAQLADGESPAQTPVYHVSGGADRLIAALCAATPATLLLQHVVRGVALATDRVVVRVTDRSGMSHEISGDAVVMAVPASTLRDIEISPPLPEMQRRAIRRLRYGRATKAAVQCAGAGLSGRRAKAFATDEPVGAFWDASGAAPAGTSAVISFLAGGRASSALRSLARGGASRLLARLCWLDLAGAPVIASRVHTWEDDPFARGGYAYFDPAFDPGWIPLLARSAGRMVFAGEHTSEEHQGYMEGAVESGERAADEVQRRAAA